MQEINELIDIGRELFGKGDSLRGLRIVKLANKIASDLGDLTKCHGCEKWFDDDEIDTSGPEPRCNACKAADEQNDMTKTYQRLYFER